MFDSIFHINTDTVPFYISKGVVPIDTFRTSFVPFDNIPTTEQMLLWFSNMRKKKFEDAIAEILDFYTHAHTCEKNLIEENL